MAIVTANYTGKCFVCKGRIEKGQPLEHLGPKRNKHPDCQEQKKERAKATTTTETKARTKDFGESWRSWDSYVDHVESLGLSTDSGDVTHNAGSNFTAYTNMKEAIKLAREGWPQGLKTIRALSGPMIDKIGSRIERMDPYYTVEPGSIEFGRYFDGEPECCLELIPTLVEGPGKFVNIGINGLVSAGISTQIIANRGATLLALIELLEYAGCRVRLTQIYYNSNHHDSIKRIDKILLKSYEQPLEWNRLAFTAMHAAALRCLEFRIYECMEESDRALFNTWNGGSYGKVEETKEEVRKEYDIYFDGVHLNQGNKYDTLEDCMKTLLEHLERQGVSLT